MLQGRERLVTYTRIRLNTLSSHLHVHPLLYLLPRGDGHAGEAQMLFLLPRGDGHAGEAQRHCPSRRVLPSQNTT
jgi:hypothetical protein